jgi:hypothetical protein
MRAARASESTAKKFLTDADNKIAKRARAIMPRAQREDADRQDKEDAVRAYQQHMDKASYHKDQASSVVKYIRPALFEAMNKANEKEEKKPSSDLKSLMSR